MLYIQSTGYLAIKRNKLLTHAITWKNFYNIMLSERSHSQNNHLCETSRTDKSIETERLVKLIVMGSGRNKGKNGEW